jgi:hypothetical protein
VGRSWILQTLLGRRPGTSGLRQRRWRFQALLEALEDRTLPAISFTSVPSWLEEGPSPTQNGQTVGLTNNPVDGAVNSVAADPTNAANLYAAAVGGGIWHTTNGTSATPLWLPLTDQLPSLAISTIKFSPLDATEQTLFAGTGRFSSGLNAAGGAGLGGQAIGLLRTTDGGGHWTILGKGVFSQFNVNELVASKLQMPGQVILVATPGGLFRSTDGGNNFAAVAVLAGNVTDVVSDPGNNMRYYAGVANQGVYQSTDGGKTWNAMNNGITGTGSASIIKLTVFNSATANVVYAALQNGGTTSGVFRSTNQAANWRQIQNFQQPNASGFGGFGRGNLSIVADPTDSTVFFIAGDDQSSSPFVGVIFRVTCNDTTPSSDNWVSVVEGGANNTAPHADDRSLTFDFSGNLLETDDGGIYRLANPDAGTRAWAPVDGTLQVTEFYSIAFDTANQIIFGGAQDTGSPQQNSTGSTTWNEKTILQGDGGYQAIDNTNHIRYSLSDNFQTFRRRTFDTNNNEQSDQQVQLASTAGGTALGGLNAADTAVDTNNQFFLIPFALDAVNPARMVLGLNGLYEDDQSGAAHATGDVIKTRTGTGQSGVSALAYGGTQNGTPNAEVLYAGFSNATIYLRTAAGDTWTKLNYPLAAGAARRIVLDPANYQTAYVISNTSVYQVTNAGANNEKWINLTGNLTSLTSNLQALELFKSGSNTVLLAAGFGGVFRGPFDGTNPPVWSQFGSMPNVLVDDVHYYSGNDVLIAGTYGRGAYELQNVSGTISTSNTQTAAEGASTAFNLGSFSDSDGGGPWTVDVNWGDGTQDTIFTVAASGSLGTQTHTYGEEGTYRMIVTVTDTTMGDSGSEGFATTISDPAVAQDGPVAVSADEGAAFTGKAVAKFTDPAGAEPNPSDPTDGIASHYKVVSIDWGDSSPLDMASGSIVYNGVPMDGSKTNTFTVSGSHTYGEEGTYTVKVVINHEGQPTTLTSTATVSDPAVVQASAIPVSAVEGAAFTGVPLATYTDPGGAEPNPSDPTDGIPSHYKVMSIDWGDSTPLDMSSGLIVYNGVPMDGSKTNTFTVSGSHTYGEEGTYTIKVVIDHEGRPTTLTSTATVSDPAVKAQGVDVSAKECIAFNVPVATFTDPGGAEPNPSDNIDGIPSHYTASVDFGDGKGASPAVITYNGVPLDGSKTNTFTVTAMHTFDEEGTFTVTETINHEGAVSTVVHSTATVRDNFGLLLLDPTGDKSLMVTGNGSVTVNHCGAVVVDSSNPRAIFLTGNAVVTATEADVGLGGDAVTHGHATLNLLEPEFNHEAATPDPFGLALPPAPSPTFPAVHVSTGSVTLPPGTYDGGIAVDGTAAVTLTSGIYYMNGGGFSVSGQGSVTDNGSGVLIVNAPTGPSDQITFDGQASVNLAAISGLTGALAAYNHMTIFQDPAAANTVMITGQASLTMTGVLYAPAALLKIDGKANAVVSTDTNPTGGIVVAFDTMVTGNGALTINADPPDFAVPVDAGSTTATASAAVVLAPPSGAARATQPIAPVVATTDFASAQAALARNGPAGPATVIVAVVFSPSAGGVPMTAPSAPGVLMTTITVAPAAAPAVVPSPANLRGAGNAEADDTSDGPSVPTDQQPAPLLAPATPAPAGERSGLLPSQAHDAVFAGDDSALADIVGEAPAALDAANGATLTPSVLAGLGLALGLPGLRGARHCEDEKHRRRSRLQ